MKIKYSRQAVAARALGTITVIGSVLLAATSFAQSQSPSAADPTQSPTERVAPVIITGNPLGLEKLSQPNTVVTAAALADRRASTLGETLNGLAGVSASQFSPGASRPIIRGLDGERVRVLDDGAHSHDVSTLSFDHGVPIEPLALERIEVLRGPATLLYGGGAVGGVVNAISNRIARTPTDGLATDVTGQVATGSRSQSVGARLSGGGAGLSLNVDASTRDSGDLRTPRFTRPDGESTDRVANSAQRADSGGLGASWSGAAGYFGVSLDTYRSRYGVVAEEDVTIRMQRDRVLVAGAWRTPLSGVADITGHFAMTRYAHDEIEGNGAIGTTFRNRGEEFRLTATTLPMRDWRLAFGAQGLGSRANALGEEAFVPPTETRSLAAFGLAQRNFGNTELSVGMRGEVTRQRTSAVLDDEGHARFGPAQSRRTRTLNLAIGVASPLTTTVTATANLTAAERAPSDFERFADGVHVATGAYERGNASLPTERGQLLDVGLVWKSGAHSLRANTYYSQYQRFISLDATGETAAGQSHNDASATALPVYAFRAVPARIYGAEAEATARLFDAADRVDLTARIDVVRAYQRDTGEPLPRIAPLRATLEAQWSRGPWQLRGEVQHAARQSRIPWAERDVTAAGDGTTPAHTVFNVRAHWRFVVGRSQARLTLAGLNLTNQLAYNASTIRTIRELAPIPGRQLRIGIEWSL